MAFSRLVIGNKNYSSWSLRAWLLLRHAGIGFGEERIPLFEPDSKARILAISPAGKVPVWILGDCVIWESLAIAEEVAARCPELWPADPVARAMARAVSSEMHGGFGALRHALPMNARATGRQVAISAAVEADIARIRAIWHEARTRFGRSGPWLFGQYSVADAMFAPVMLRFRTYGIALEGPAADYAATVLADPLLQIWIAEACEETEVIADEEVGQV